MNRMTHTTTSDNGKTTAPASTIMDPVDRTGLIGVDVDTLMNTKFEDLVGDNDDDDDDVEAGGDVVVVAGDGTLGSPTFFGVSAQTDIGRASKARPSTGKDTGMARRKAAANCISEKYTLTFRKFSPRHSILRSTILPFMLLTDGTNTSPTRFEIALNTAVRVTDCSAEPLSHVSTITKFTSKPFVVVDVVSVVSTRERVVDADAADAACTSSQRVAVPSSVAAAQMVAESTSGSAKRISNSQ